MCLRQDRWKDIFKGASGAGMCDVVKPTEQSINGME